MCPGLGQNTQVQCAVQHCSLPSQHGLPSHRLSSPFCPPVLAGRLGVLTSPGRHTDRGNSGRSHP